MIFLTKEQKDILKEIVSFLDELKVIGKLINNSFNIEVNGNLVKNLILKIDVKREYYSKFLIACKVTSFFGQSTIIFDKIVVNRLMGDKRNEFKNKFINQYEYYENLFHYKIKLKTLEELRDYIKNFMLTIIELEIKI
jgi:hypothetical protein